MTLGELLDELEIDYVMRTPNEIENYELQFHYNCIWYEITKLDRIDIENKRIILGEYFPDKNTKHIKETK